MIQASLLWTAATCAIVGSLRITFLLLFRRPVLARVTGLALGEGERLCERDMHAVARFDGIPTSDDIEYRPTDARVIYEVNGVSYRSDVYLIRHSGDRPEMTPVIWYDPCNPSRATGIGLGPAIMLLFVAGGVAVLGYCAPL